MAGTCSVRLALSMLTMCTGAALVLHAQDAPQFRLGVELVPLTVTATDPDGNYVSDLTAEDFNVYEDGRPQEVVFFARTDARMAVSILIDTSGSMDPRLDLAQHAAKSFVKQLREGDYVQIIDFNDRVEVSQAFTNDRSALTEALDNTSADGLTSLYDAVYIALRTYETQPPPQDPEEVRRHVIVVLSDGEDTSSLLGFDAVLDAAKRSQSVIYAIGLALEPTTTPQNPQLFRVLLEDPRYILRELARETGGRMLLTSKADELGKVYDEIAEELANQYVLGYEPQPSQGDEEWRTIGVRVNRPNVVARTRPGYFVDGDTRRASR